MNIAPAGKRSGGRTKRGQLFGISELLAPFPFGKTRHSGFYTILTGPTSQNYGAAVEATHAKKAKL